VPPVTDRMTGLPDIAMSARIVLCAAYLRLIEALAVAVGGPGPDGAAEVRGPRYGLRYLVAAHPARNIVAT